MENKFKRFLSLLLALVMVLGMMPMGQAKAEEGETFSLISEKVSLVKDGGTYVICLAGSMKAMTNERGAQDWNTHTLATAMCQNRAAEAKNMWTLEAVQGGYKIKNGDKYLEVNRNIAKLTDNGHVFALVHTNAGWTIKSLTNNEYFNNLGGKGSIGGYSGDGTKFDLYKVVETSVAEDPYGKLRGLWTKVNVDSEAANKNDSEGEFWKAFDSNPATHWHSNYGNPNDKVTNNSGTAGNKDIIAGEINFGKEYTINRFSFTPRQNNDTSGQVTKASLYVKSATDTEWRLVEQSKTFDANKTKKTFSFDERAVQYVRFEAERSSDGWVTVSEFEIDYVDSEQEQPTAVNAKILGSDRVVALEDCLYTLNGEDDAYSLVHEGTYYVKPRSDNTPTAPQSATAFNGLDLVWLNNGAVLINGGGGGMHFHTEHSKPYWNRCEGSNFENDGKHHIYLFRADANSTNEHIRGYTKVTAADMKAGESYLIAAKNEAGNWFVMYPAASNAGQYNHIAQVVADKVTHEHDYVPTTLAATCTADGREANTCDVCGHFHTTKVLPATGHSYSGVCDPDCNACDVTRDAEEHTYISIYDPICNGCGAEREVKTFGSQKLTGITGEASSNDSNDGSKVDNAFDGNIDEEYWASVNNNVTIEGKQHLTAVLDSTYLVNKVVYYRRTVGSNIDGKTVYTGRLMDCTIHVSTDKETWIPVTTLDSLSDDESITITFPAVEAKYVKLTATKSDHWDPTQRNRVMSCAEFEIFKAVCNEGEHTWVCGSGDTHATCSICFVEGDAAHINTEDRTAVLPTLGAAGKQPGVFCNDCEAFISGGETIAQLVAKNATPLMDNWRNNSRGVVSLSDCEYVLSGTEGSYSLCNDGTYYVNPSNGGGKPQQTVPFAELSLSIAADGKVQISGGGKTLQVNNVNKAVDLNSSNKYHPWWHNFEKEQTDFTTDFYLLKENPNSTNADIPGYEIVTQVKDGESYLIAFKNSANEWFVMYPSSTETVALAMVVASKGEFEITYTNISMANDLKVNFAFKRDAVANWSGYYAEIVKNYADSRGPVTVTVPFADWKLATINGAPHYYVTFDGVAAKEMTDEFYVTIYDAEDQAVSKTYTDTVAAYAHRSMAKNNSENNVHMIADMLNYGAAAQNYFDYNTDNLANANLAEDLKSRVETVTLERTEAEYEPEQSENFSYLANVDLESNIRFMMSFTGITPTMEALITYESWNGVSKRIVIPAKNFEKGDNGCYFTIEDTVIADADQPITCTIYNGHEPVFTVTDYIKAYASRAADDNANDSKKVAMYKAIVQFSESARAYLQAKKDSQGN